MSEGSGLQSREREREDSGSRKGTSSQSWMRSVTLNPSVLKVISSSCLLLTGMSRCSVGEEINSNDKGQCVNVCVNIVPPRQGVPRASLKMARRVLRSGSPMWIQFLILRY